MNFSRELIPYLLRSVYDWCCDNGLRTMLLVRDDGGSVLPRQHVQEGFIVLDISKAAVQNLDFGADAVSFEASFDGESFAVEVANEEVVCIGSLERKIGMVVPGDWGEGKEKPRQKLPAAGKKGGTGKRRKKSGGRPELKLI